MRVTSSREFKSLSVTADQWVPIESVSPKDINIVLQYLLGLKRKGFSLVALEQTSNSVKLGSFTFPDKVVLILGREREGVPFEVLQIADYCLEIPQYGLVRSLNVHVGGALCI